CARNAEATRQARTHVDDLLIEEARDFPHPRDVAPISVGIVEPLGGIEIGPEGAVAVERHLPSAEAIVCNLVLEDSPEHLRIDLLVRRELRSRDGVELRQ